MIWGYHYFWKHPYDPSLTSLLKTVFFLKFEAASSTPSLMLPVYREANPSETAWHERVKGWDFTCIVFTTRDDDLLSLGGIFLTMKIHIWVVV